jgi:hypothetical protein
VTKTIARAAIGALPYVNGESRRIAAAPTKLTPLAGKVMVASGALSTPSKIASFPIVRIAALLALVAMAAAYFLSNGPSSAQTLKAEMTRSEARPVAVCVLDQREAAATEREQETRAGLPYLASAAGVFERQDRFEIDRFIRLSSAVRHQEIIQHRSGSRSSGVSAR